MGVETKTNEFWFELRSRNGVVLPADNVPMRMRITLDADGQVGSFDIYEGWNDNFRHHGGGTAKTLVVTTARGKRKGGNR